MAGPVLDVEGGVVLRKIRVSSISEKWIPRSPDCSPGFPGQKRVSIRCSARTPETSGLTTGRRGAPSNGLTLLASGEGSFRRSSRSPQTPCGEVPQRPRGERPFVGGNRQATFGDVKDAAVVRRSDLDCEGLRWRCDDLRQCRCGTRCDPAGAKQSRRVPRDPASGFVRKTWGTTRSPGNRREKIGSASGGQRCAARSRSFHDYAR